MIIKFSKDENRLLALIAVERILNLNMERIKKKKRKKSQSSSRKRNKTCFNIQKQQ